MAQLLDSRQAAATVEIVVKIGNAKDRLFQKAKVALRISFGLQPFLEVRFVGKVFPRHVSRIAAEGNLANGIDAKKRDGRPVRIVAKEIVRNQPLAGGSPAQSGQRRNAFKLATRCGSGRTQNTDRAGVTAV